MLKFSSNVPTGSLSLAHSRPFQQKTLLLLGSQIVLFFPLYVWQSLLFNIYQSLLVEFNSCCLLGNIPIPPLSSPVLHHFVLWYSLGKIFNFLPALLLLCYNHYFCINFNLQSGEYFHFQLPDNSLPVCSLGSSVFVALVVTLSAPQNEICVSI